MRKSKNITPQEPTLWCAVSHYRTSPYFLSADHASPTWYPKPTNLAVFTKEEIEKKFPKDQYPYVTFHPANTIIDDFSKQIIDTFKKELAEKINPSPLIVKMKQLDDKSPPLYLDEHKHWTTKQEDAKTFTDNKKALLFSGFFYTHVDVVPPPLTKEQWIVACNDNYFCKSGSNSKWTKDKSNATIYSSRKEAENVIVKQLGNMDIVKTVKV